MLKSALKTSQFTVKQWIRTCFIFVVCPVPAPGTDAGYSLQTSARCRTQQNDISRRPQKSDRQRHRFTDKRRVRYVDVKTIDKFESTRFE